jgi:hypothetical protein
MNIKDWCAFCVYINRKNLISKKSICNFNQLIETCADMKRYSTYNLSVCIGFFNSTIDLIIYYKYNI